MWEFKSATIIRKSEIIWEGEKTVQFFIRLLKLWPNWQAILETPKSFQFGYHFIWFEIHFSPFKSVNYRLVQLKLALCQKQEILRRNRLWIYVRCFSSPPLSFSDTQNPYAHTHILIYIIYADIDGILWVERGGRCLEGSLSLPADLCYYHWNVAFSLETVKRVLWPQKGRCLQNYLPPHICS